MGFEGANVIFDTWVHPLVMGLEEHLLHMFRDDFEFHDEAGPSITAARPKPPEPRARRDRPGRRRTGARQDPAGRRDRLAADAEKELKKIPFFVRGKARRNTETFAAERGVRRSASTPFTRQRPIMRDDVDIRRQALSS
jgi:light-independent protochlorophyllide reductase subunit B